MSLPSVSPFSPAGVIRRESETTNSTMLARSCLYWQEEACFLSLFSKARLRVMPNGVKVLSVFGFPSDKIFTSLFLLVPPRAIFFPFGSASLTCDP